MTEPVSAPADSAPPAGPSALLPPAVRRISKKHKEHEKWTSPPPVTCLAAAVLTVTGVTGIAFTLSWIAGLAVPAPSPKLTASGT